MHQGRVTWVPLSWATLAFCFPDPDLFFVCKSEPWVEDTTPRVCSYLVEHSLQLGTAPFWEERSFTGTDGQTRGPSLP